MSIVNLLRGAYNVARPALRSTAVDTITNPQTYIGLADDVTNTLGRMLPKGFQGGGIQRAPMNLLGQVDDIANMSSGAAKELARDQTARNFRMAGRLDDAVRPVGQGPTGALRAPNVGPKVTRSTPASSAPSSALPGGGPLQRDNEASRALLREVIKQRKALTPAQRAAGAGALAGGGALAASETGAGQGITDQIQGALNNVGPAIDNFVGGLNLPFQKELQQFGREQEKRGFGSLLDFATGVTGVTGMLGLNDLIPNSDPLTPAQIEDLKKKNPGLNIPSQASTRTEGTSGAIPPTVNTNLGAYDPGVTLPGGGRNVVVEDPATDVPPDPDTTYNLPNPTPAVEVPKPEIGAAMDPYAYQLNVYGQGRQASATQSSDAAVRDLGLSIHRQMFPQFYNDDVPKTPVQVPTTMNTADALSELNSSTKAVEELIDPTILAQLTAMNLRRTGY